MGKKYGREYLRESGKTEKEGKNNGRESVSTEGERV